MRPSGSSLTYIYILGEIRTGLRQHENTVEYGKPLWIKDMIELGKQVTHGHLKKCILDREGNQQIEQTVSTWA